MSDIHDARPRDIYVDQNGQLWEVTAYWDTPTLEMHRIYCDGDFAQGQPETMHGSFYGHMWDGFKRIYRPEERPKRQSIENDHIAVEMPDETFPGPIVRMDDAALEHGVLFLSPTGEVVFRLGLKETEDGRRPDYVAFDEGGRWR